jgi:hypothetical protein
VRCVVADGVACGSAKRNRLGTIDVCVLVEWPTMSNVVMTMTTYVCDIPNCNEENTFGGELAYDNAEEAGWLLDFPIGAKHYDLCPKSKHSLENFLGIKIGTPGDDSQI